MQSKNPVRGISVLLSGVCMLLLLLIFTPAINTARGEGTEVIIINGSQVYSFTPNEFTLSESLLMDENMVHFLVDEYPVFPHAEGIKEFVEGLIKYPEEALKNHVEGVVLVSFVVEKDGTLSTPRFIRSLGFGCEEEILRIIKRFPAATPGKIAGQPVRVGITLPVSFKL